MMFSTRFPLLPLLCLLLCALLSVRSLSSASQDLQPRARRHPTRSSRQRGAEAECVAGYRERIVHHCRYPDMEEPCFQLPAGADDWTEAVDQMARGCCGASGDGAARLCSVDDFEELCCRGLDCLAKCYGPDFLETARNRFRYLDILLNHPHPESRKEAAEAAMMRKAEEEEEQDE